MASVFASPQVYGGSFRADHVQLIIGGEPVGGMVFQGINGSFATQISLLFELGSNFVYYVQGRAMPVTRATWPFPPRTSVPTKPGTVSATDSARRP